MSQLVCPGQIVASQETLESGEGTYIGDSGTIRSLLVGKTEITASKSSEKPKVCVRREGTDLAYPQEGSSVTVKITKVSPRSANADILLVGGRPVEAFSGSIRSTDVRATEVDKVDILSCFRPGDIVRAQILSSGDARSFYLTTAKPELGVIFAKSLAGQPMVPISWQEMQCPETKALEKRKVAKVTA